MKDEDKEYIRAFAAMFAMAGVLIDRGRGPNYVIEEAFKYADAFMDALDSDVSGIAAIKTKRKYERKAP